MPVDDSSRASFDDLLVLCIQNREICQAPFFVEVKQFKRGFRV